MKNFYFLILFQVFCSAAILSQPHTSLTDIYMGNFGYQDYQSTGSLQVLEGDSINNQWYHSVYLTSDSTFINPQKRVLYFFSSDNGNTWNSAVVANVNSSYPSLALQSDGKAVICFLDSAASKIRFYRSTSAGVFTFDTLPSPPGTAGTNPKILYYRNYLILFALFPGNQLQKTRYNYLTSSWETWQTVNSNVTQAFQIAKGWNGKVSAGWLAASNNSVNYCESSDSGSTFGSPNTVFTQDITSIDTVKAYLHIDMVYYQNQPSITWDAIARILPIGGQSGIRKFYQNPRIYFWNSANGIKIVSDSSSSGSNSFPGRNFMISMGSNWSTMCGPSIGVAGYPNDNNMYICYSAVKTSVPFGNLWYDSDIFIKMSNSGGSFWQSYYPPATTDNINDDRFVCLNKKSKTNFGYSFAYVNQKDKFPGSFRAGDTTSITRAYPEFYYITIFVHTVLESGSDADEFDLCPNYPNPFNPSTNVEFWLPKKGHVEIAVFDLLGRKIQTLIDPSEISNVGSTHAVFDGSNYSSGIYFVRMFYEGQFVDARKMVLIK